jgi:sugar phosphate isomerase/epimerase
MAQLSMNEVTTFRWSFEEDVARYFAAGIRAMGVWRPKLADFGEARGAELLAEVGMAVSNLMWVGGFTGSEGAPFDDMIADAEEAIRVAAELSAGCLVFYSGGRYGHVLSHARRILKSALSHLDAMASDLGVTLAIEPMHPNCAEPCTIVTSLDESLAAIDAAGCRSTKIAFDTYHLGHGDVPLSAIAAAAPQMAIVHLADARQLPGDEQNRCPLGEGTLPLKEIVGALRDGGFDGYYDIELHGDDMQGRDYDKVIAASRQAAYKLGIPSRANANVWQIG